MHSIILLFARFSYLFKWRVPITSTVSMLILMNCLILVLAACGGTDASVAPVNTSHQLQAETLPMKVENGYAYVEVIINQKK